MMRVVALDFETTGVVPGWENEPWQLGLVEVVDGRVVPESRREFFFRIPHDRPFSRRAPGRWAQLRDVLDASPAWPDVWPQISDILNGAFLVAHNAATERTILEKRAPLTRFGPWIDTLKIIRAYWPTLPSFTLGDLIQTFGLQPALTTLCPDRTWHDALYDALAGALLYTHIRPALPNLP